MKVQQIQIRHDESEDRLLRQAVAKTDWDIDLALHGAKEAAAAPTPQAAPRRLN